MYVLLPCKMSTKQVPTYPSGRRLPGCIVVYLGNYLNHAHDLSYKDGGSATCTCFHLARSIQTCGVCANLSKCRLPVGCHIHGHFGGGGGRLGVL